jgi:hypothetical protein
LAAPHSTPLFTGTPSASPRTPFSLLFTGI